MQGYWIDMCHSLTHAAPTPPVSGRVPWVGRHGRTNGQTDKRTNGQTAGVSLWSTGQLARPVRVTQSAYFTIMPVVDTLKSALAEPDLCTVRVVRARNVAPADADGKSDPFVKFSVGAVTTPSLEWSSPAYSLRLQTKVIQDTLDPVWEEDVAFDLSELAEKIEIQNFPPYVVMELWDYDSLSTGDGLVASNDLIGYARIPLHYFVNPQEVWFALFLPRKMLDEDREHRYHNAGEILLKFTPTLQRTVEDMSPVYQDINAMDTVFARLKSIPGSMLACVPPLVSHVKHEQVTQLLRNVYVSGTYSNTDKTIVSQWCHLVVTTHRLVLVPMDAQSPLCFADGPVLQIWVGSVKSCAIHSDGTMLKLVTHALQVYQIYLFSNPDEDDTYVSRNNLAEIKTISVAGHKSAIDIMGTEYTVYQVVANMADGTKTDVWRRYNDFLRVHDEVERSRRTVHPPFPAKTWFRAMETEFLNMRATALEAYLRALLDSPNGQRLFPLRRFLQNQRRRTPALSVDDVEPSVNCFVPRGSVVGASTGLCRQSQAVAAAALLSDHIFWSLHEEQFLFEDCRRIRWSHEGGTPAMASGTPTLLVGDDLYKDFSLTKEFERQFQDCDAAVSARWKKSSLNASATETDRLCITYPDVLYFPASIADETIAKAASFRKRNRVPALSYWCRNTGAPLVRCSQPRTGVGHKKLKEDVELIKAIISTATKTEGGGIMIVDCRSSVVATTNSLAGGGTENVKWYEDEKFTVTSHFCNIGNIHAMRKSIGRLANFVARKNAADAKDHFTECSWFAHLKTTMRAGLAGYEEGLKKGYAVLVHCSDGWDRTAQVTSLIQIFADPYFRTVKGFSVLVAKDFCAFGHKFSDRGGYGSSLKEASPIFLQFLDCVHQLCVQNDTAFEFNEDLLLFLAEQVYSHLFPDFLFNSEYERVVHLADGFSSASKDNIWENIEKTFHTPAEDRVPGEKYFRNDQYKGTVEGAELAFDESKIILWEHQYAKHIFAAAGTEDVARAQNTPPPVFYLGNEYLPRQIEEALVAGKEAKTFGSTKAKEVSLREIMNDDAGSGCVLV